MDDKDKSDWRDCLWLAGFMFGMGLLGAGIVLAAAYWQAMGVNL